MHRTLAAVFPSTPPLKISPFIEHELEHRASRKQQAGEELAADLLLAA
jgi:hypothetical protein